MKLKKDIGARLHKSPALWCAVISASLQGAAQFWDAFSDVLPHAPFFVIGIVLTILAALAPGIFDTSQDN